LRTARPPFIFHDAGLSAPSIKFFKIAGRPGDEVRIASRKADYQLDCRRADAEELDEAKKTLYAMNFDNRFEFWSAESKLNRTQNVFLAHSAGLVITEFFGALMVGNGREPRSSPKMNMKSHNCAT
jgi:hypothetical protein